MTGSRAPCLCGEGSGVVGHLYISDTDLYCITNATGVSGHLVRVVGERDLLPPNLGCECVGAPQNLGPECVSDDW